MRDWRCGLAVGCSRWHYGMLEVIHLGYQRPGNTRILSKAEKIALLRGYTAYYQEVAATDPGALNRKAPREAFANLLDRIGEIIIEESEKLEKSPGPIREFLEANPLPEAMAPLLPGAFRTFCLALNALKQWVAAEQASTDRYLLGGTARQVCREAVDVCLLTGDSLGADAELHHPVRDGRPPILLSKKGHARIEKQISSTGDDPFERALVSLRHESNRSWASLRRGCLDLLGSPIPGGSKASAAGARSFARKAIRAVQWKYSLGSIGKAYSSPVC